MHEIAATLFHRHIQYVVATKASLEKLKRTIMGIFR